MQLVLITQNIRTTINTQPHNNNYKNQIMFLWIFTLVGYVFPYYALLQTWRWKN